MYKLLVANINTAVTLAEVKTQRRILDNREDTLLEGLILAAQELCEADTQRVLLSSQWSLTLNYFPPMIRLFKCPVKSVESITYTDAAGVVKTLPADQYNLLLDEPAIITPKGDWPDTEEGLGKVTINFTAGYATPAEVPAALKQAMHLMIGHYESNREEGVTGTITSAIKAGYDSLIHRWRVSEYQ